jgi:hypothetical protein
MATKEARRKFLGTGTGRGVSVGGGELAGGGEVVAGEVVAGEVVAGEVVGEVVAARAKPEPVTFTDAPCCPDDGDSVITGLPTASSTVLAGS